MGMVGGVGDEDGGVVAAAATLPRSLRGLCPVYGLRQRAGTGRRG